MQKGDLVRFMQQENGVLSKNIYCWPMALSKYWTIGLCLSYDKVQGIVTILYRGKIIKQPKWTVEKAGKKDIKFRRLDETR